MARENTPVKLEPQDVQAATEAGILTPEQGERLWTFLRERSQDQPGFRATHILYYLGGLIAIGAMTLFMNLGWERYGGWGLFGISIAYALLGLGLTEMLLKKRLRIPAGTLAAFTIALTPLAVYALQVALGVWPDATPYQDYHVYVKWQWILMELATLATGAILFFRYRIPFLLMPVAVTLWYMSMDLAPFLFDQLDWVLYWEVRKWVSLWFGLLITLLAFWVDLRSRHARDDYAFWLYLFGVLAFWGGLSLMNSDSELNKFIYLCINLGLIAIGATLSRRIFAICGGIGVAMYLGHLAYDLFKNSLLFPFVLTFIGLAVIGLGIKWQKYEARIQRRMLGLLPRAVAELLERRQEG